MSKPKKAEGNCPRCGAEVNFTVWDSVNTDLFPDLPQRIISGEFFRYRCHACGNTGQIEYPTLYHDMKHSAMIWIVQKDDNYEERVKEIRNTSLFGDGYITRIVHDVDELREKVSALEAGRDDRIIEMLKHLIGLQFMSERPAWKRPFIRLQMKRKPLNFMILQGMPKEFNFAENAAKNC